MMLRFLENGLVSLTKNDVHQLNDYILVNHESTQLKIACVYTINISKC
jgi:hypothetical protein